MCFSLCVFLLWDVMFKQMKTVNQLELVTFFVFLFLLRNLAAVFALYLEHWFGSRAWLFSRLVHVIPLWHWCYSDAWSRLYY